MIVALVFFARRNHSVFLDIIACFTAHRVDDLVIVQVAFNLRSEFRILLSVNLAAIVARYRYFFLSYGQGDFGSFNCVVGIRRTDLDFNAADVLDARHFRSPFAVTDFILYSRAFRQFSRDRRGMLRSVIRCIVAFRFQLKRCGCDLEENIFSVNLIDVRDCIVSLCVIAGCYHRIRINILAFCTRHTVFDGITIQQTNNRCCQIRIITAISLAVADRSDCQRQRVENRCDIIAILNSNFLYRIFSVNCQISFLIFFCQNHIDLSTIIYCSNLIVLNFLFCAEQVMMNCIIVLIYCFTILSSEHHIAFHSRQRVIRTICGVPIFPTNERIGVLFACSLRRGCTVVLRCCTV